MPFTCLGKQWQNKECQKGKIRIVDNIAQRNKTYFVFKLSNILCTY
jgi:hypothetical protein